MKLTKQLFGFAITAMAAGALVSCTNELSDINPGKDGLSSIKLVKTPEVYAWSGQETLQNTVSAPSDVITRGTDMNANMWDQKWDCPPRPAEDLTDEELAELKDLLSKGKETHNDIVIPFENYYVQQIYKGEDTYNTHDRCNQNGCDHVNNQTELGSGHMEKLVAYGYNGYEHINNFNNGTNNNYPGTCGCGEVHYKTTLMTGMPTAGIDPEKQFGFHETWGTSPKDFNNYIIVKYKGYYYVGFDYEAHKNDQTTHNHNEGMDIPRDWNFTDWIVRITPAYPKGTNSEYPGGIIDDNTSSDKDTCEKCGDSIHEGNICPDCVATECHPAVCDKCKHGVIWDDLQGKFIHVAQSKNGEGKCGECESTGLPCNDDNLKRLVGDRVYGDNADQGDDTPSTNPSNPATPDKTYKHNNEVEVNLEIVDSHVDKGIQDLATKLSIHVRCATDVDIKIPVPNKYVIDSDDLYIFNEHYGKFDGETSAGYHGSNEKVILDGVNQTLIYRIAEATVELHVDFVTAEEAAKENPVVSAEGYIHVYTRGIDQDVINYCMLHNGDGINFEVWTYYSIFNDLDRETLQSKLNESTIEFKGPEAPTYYINAFGYDYNGLNKNDGKNLDDCYVRPVENSGYELKYTEATHLNGTPYNDIYVKDDVTADATHSNGSTPPSPVHVY